jgi:hypothetical protein
MKDKFEAFQKDIADSVRKRGLMFVNGPDMAESGKFSSAGLTQTNGQERGVILLAVAEG